MKNIQTNRNSPLSRSKDNSVIEIMGNALKHVVITPARNEVAFIEQTIKSVIAQTVRAAKWVIVSDGSTDATDEIVGRYAASRIFARKLLKTDCCRWRSATTEMQLHLVAPKR